MSQATGAAGEGTRPAARAWPGPQGWFGIGALLLAVACLAPPIISLAGRYVLAETAQFACFAMVIPALVVLSAPWRLLGLARRTPAADPGSPPGNTSATYTDGRNPGAGHPAAERPADRLARIRAGNPSFTRSVAFLATFAAVSVAWRLPPVIDAVARDQGLLVPELASLLIAGVALWLEMVPSPPLQPRGRELHQAVTAAFAMWLIWIIAFIQGSASRGVFHAYRYHPGGPLSAVADQELATAVLWAVAAACFMPVIFTAAYHWLHDSDNEEAELERATDTAALPTVKGWGPPPRRR
ncbi:MAG: cytochrome c oxidase assembly protein [Streptosporangiaceae bacterium]